MDGIGETCQRRTGTTPLDSALTEGRRIGHLMVIEDIIDIETLDTGMKTVETCAPHFTDISIANFHILYLIVISRLPVIKVYTEQVCIKAHIQFLPLAIIM